MAKNKPTAKKPATRGKTIDLNADLGEGMASDAEMLQLVSSANVACGFHAGGAETMAKTISQVSNRVMAYGVHPSYNDRANFGRVETGSANNLVVADVVYQIGALLALAQAFDKDILYLKLHGALYHRASQDRELAEGLVWATSHFDLAILGLPESELEKEARKAKVHFYREGFADRRYGADGRLAPRDQPNAFITDPSEGFDQVQKLMAEKGIQSICVHGDNPDAVAFTKSLRLKLEEAGYAIRPFIE